MVLLFCVPKHTGGLLCYGMTPPASILGIMKPTNGSAENLVGSIKKLIDVKSNIPGFGQELFYLIRFNLIYP